MFPVTSTGLQKTTAYQVVIPFYFYATIVYLLATVFLFLHSELGMDHYFSPNTLSLTHMMSLGWGTMIILGASHQLLPVLIEGKLFKTSLAYLTFFFTAIGIPFLVYGFYQFNFGWITQLGAVLINLGVLLFFVNVIGSSIQNKKANIHAWFIATATLWLLSTTLFGMVLVFNFQTPLLASESVRYLSIHAHMGIVGWFLMMILGVGSRLIPMFLISKYQHKKTLWSIYILVNSSLLLFIGIKIELILSMGLLVPFALILTALILFGNYCYQSFKVRIRKNVDLQMKTSLVAVLQMFIPLLIILGVMIIHGKENNSKFGMLYGYCIFFGWITAIIMGMTFKTLPFIIWNKMYHKKAHIGKTPAPKELFSESIYYTSWVSYILGFLTYGIGILEQNDLVLKGGAAFLVLSAIMYLLNVMIVFLHKPKTT
jgi:hypothetical protein